MAIFTLTEIAEQKAAYKAAMLAIASGKEYVHAGETLKHEDLPQIRKTLAWLDAEEQKLTAGKSPIRMTVGIVRRG